MTVSDYIRRAVELARWQTIRLGNQRVCVFIPTDDSKTVHQIGYLDQQYVFDVLAAHLRKQAQSDPHIVFKISVVDSASYVEMIIYNPNGDEEADPLLFVANETDEAMAFLKVIVDSEVLRPDDGR